MKSITKTVLLRTDPALKNRPYQTEALLSIFQHQKCLVKMFCGTGKSRIITNVIIHNKKNLSVVVFPSLALLHQYSDDYLNNDEYKKHFKNNSLREVVHSFFDTVRRTPGITHVKLKIGFFFAAEHRICGPAERG
jgi:superfamily II DNA or RNA helicase